MKYWIFVLVSSVLPSVAAAESLQYSINWPSGLNLGEGRITSKSTDTGWNLEMQFEASVPGFRVLDKFLSMGNGDCSSTFEKDTLHGRKRTREKISFDGAKGTATRETIGGGKSELRVTACPRDVLAFLFHLRHELGQGRIPQAQEVYYGSTYRVRVEYKGSQKIRLGDAMEEADRVLAHINGPASDLEIEAFFGKDTARTPLMVKVPLGMATFSVELVREK